jgi:hypothetical protein
VDVNWHRVRSFNLLRYLSTATNENNPAHALPTFSTNSLIWNSQVSLVHDLPAVLPFFERGEFRRAEQLHHLPRLGHLVCGRYFWSLSQHVDGVKCVVEIPEVSVHHRSNLCRLRGCLYNSAKCSAKPSVLIYDQFLAQCCICYCVFVRLLFPSLFLPRAVLTFPVA